MEKIDGRLGKGEKTMACLAAGRRCIKTAVAAMDVEAAAAISWLTNQMRKKKKGITTRFSRKIDNAIWNNSLTVSGSD